MVNVVTTEFSIVALYLSLLVITSQHQSMITILFIVGLVFPVAFYHHSWSLWLGFDYLVESLPKYVQEDGRQTKAGSSDGVDGQKRNK